MHVTNKDEISLLHQHFINREKMPCDDHQMSDNLS